MPELPEVQTIVNGLIRGDESHPSLQGSWIRGIEILWMKTIQYPGPDEFINRLLNQQILLIERRGKFIIIRSRENQLLIHLRMSGDLFLRPRTLEFAKHDRLILMLENGYDLVFNDPRKFGRVWLVGDESEVLGNLGPEPFDSDLNETVFYEKLSKKKKQIKPLLLDQTFLAGLGNIYSDEALFLAGIHPLTRADQISQEKAGKLLSSIRKVLLEGIQNHGASIDWVYRGGEFQTLFRVYRRTGLSCPTCGDEIQRILVGQRSTHFCPHCQPNSH